MSDEELSVEAGDKKLSLKSQSLNTILTILCLVCSVLILYAVVGHSNDARDVAKEWLAAVKDQTQAIRQNNCLNEFPPEKREQGAALCKRVTQ